MNCLMGMSRKPVGEKLHFHVGIKTHFDVDIYKLLQTVKKKCFGKTAKSPKHSKNPNSPIY